MTDRLDTARDAVERARDWLRANDWRHGMVAKGNKTVVADLMDAVSALLDEREAQGWQPIETAPKDGRLVLVRAGRRVTIARPGSTGWLTVPGAWSIYPTIWHQIPSFPDEAIG